MFCSDQFIVPSNAVSQTTQVTEEKAQKEAEEKALQANLGGFKLVNYVHVS